MIKVEGSCHCGAIAYAATVDPERVTLCHCTDCQTLTGSAYRVSVPAARDAFTLQSGQPKIYIKTAASGAKRVQAFCAECSAPIYSSAVVDPPVYNLRVGGLRQRALLPPKKRIWCASMLDWSVDVSSLPQVEHQ